MGVYNIFEGNNKNNFFNQKLIVNIEENSELNILVYTINLNTYPIFLNTSNFFLLEKNSLLKLFYLNELSKKDLNYNFTETKILENANFENFILSYSSSFFKNEINCDLKEKYSSGFINGAVFAKKNQHHEIKTKVNHFGETTKSYQKIKSIVDKNSKTIFQGKIYVDQKAQKTNAFQSNNNILLSDEAKINTKPQLEIWADDVKCSHGCTVGQLDKEAIFYLQSRGISRKKAISMLLGAFSEEIIEKIENQFIKQKIKKITYKKLEYFTS